MAGVARMQWRPCVLRTTATPPAISGAPPPPSRRRGRYRCSRLTQQSHLTDHIDGCRGKACRASCPAFPPMLYLEQELAFSCVSCEQPHPVLPRGPFPPESCESMRRPLSTRHDPLPHGPFPAREGGWGLGLPFLAAILPLLPPSHQWQIRQSRLNSRSERRMPRHNIKKRQKRQC